MTSTRIRMSPESRREQLLEIGVAMLGSRSLEEMSIELLAEEAGVSRGLLYHYFRNKQEFHLAVVSKAVEDLIAITAPRDNVDPMTQLRASMAAYVDYVEANYQGYASLVRAAAGGNEDLRRVYQEARTALTTRVFDAVGADELITLGFTDTPATRLVAEGWAAFCEDTVMRWVAEGKESCTRDELLTVITGALPALMSLAG